MLKVPALKDVHAPGLRVAPGPRVLLVDSDPGAQGAAAEALVAHGYNVMQAPTGTDGLRLARRYKPEVIVTELILPGLSGLDLLDQLRRHPETWGIPVVVASASAAWMLDSERRRVRAVIQKPYSTRRLLDHLRRLAPMAEHLPASA